MELTGHEQSASPSATWYMGVHPDDIEAIRTEFHASMTESRLFSLDFRFVRPDGEVTWVSGRVNALRNVDGEITQFLGAVVDISERMKLRKALASSQEMTDSFFEHSPDIVHLYDPDGSSRRMNAVLRQRHGVAQGTERERGFNLLTDPRASGTPLQQAFQAALRGEVAETGAWQPTPEVFNAENELFHARRWLEHTVFPVLDAHGKVISVFVCGRDVTERENSRKALADSEARFRSVFETVSTGIAVYDGSSLAYVNPAFCRIFGVTPEEARTANPERSFVDQEARVKLQEKVSAGDSGLHVYRARRRDGSQFDAAVEFTKLGVDSGWENGTIVTVRDITAYENSRRALETSEANLRAFLDSVDDLIYVFEQQDDGSMRATYANATTQKALRKPLEEMLGKTPTEIIPGFWGEHLNNTVVTVANTLEGVAYETDRGRRPGDYVLWSHVNPIVDERTGRVRVIGAARDITEMRAAQRIAQDHARLQSLSVLAAGIAHDFNNLLQAMLIGVDIAGTMAPAGWEGNEILDDVRESAKKAAVLAHQMLSFSGGRLIRRIAVDLPSVCKNAASSAGAGSNVRLVLDSEPYDPPLMTFGDSQQLEQAVAAIVTNAVEACEENGGSVQVTLTKAFANEQMLARSAVRDSLPPGEYAIVRVSDTGVGMDAELQRQIFEPFFSTRFVGRGLGLAATLGIVRGHGGTILVESEPGEGSTLSILLPIHRQTAELAPTG